MPKLCAELVAHAPNGALGARLNLHGDIDLARSDEIDAAVFDAIQRGATSLTIDLASVTFMDSQGLRALASAHRSMKGAVTLAAVPPTVQRTLRMAGMNALFVLPS